QAASGPDGPDDASAEEGADDEQEQPQHGFGGHLQPHSARMSATACAIARGRRPSSRAAVASSVSRSFEPKKLSTMTAGARVSCSRYSGGPPGTGTPSGPTVAGPFHERAWATAPRSRSPMAPATAADSRRAASRPRAEPGQC